MRRLAIQCTILAAAAASLWLHGTNAVAQGAGNQSVTDLLIIPCNQKYTYHPSLGGYWDRVSTPTSGDPSVATGAGGPAGMNTAGAIDIDAKSSGQTTITYKVEDFSGHPQTVTVIVVVWCGHGRPRRGLTGGGGNQGVKVRGDLPVPKFPTVPGTPTHRTTSCPACAGKSAALNTAIDQLASAIGALDDDEEDLSNLYAGYQIGGVGNQNAFNAAVAAINGQQAAVNADAAEVQRLQGVVRDLVKALDDCEKNCGGSGAQITPPVETPPQGGSGSTTPPLKQQSEMRSIEPGPGSAAGKGEGAYAPPIAGPGSVIVGTVVDPNEDGPHAVIVGTVDDNGKRQYLKTVTDKAGKVAMVVPAGAVSLELFEHFDTQGNPSAPARTEVGSASHLAGTAPLAAGQVPEKGPAILEGAPAIDRNVGSLALHTRDADPLTSKVLIDGKEAETYAASDSSIVARVPSDLPLGVHELKVASGGATSNAIHPTVTTMHAEPVPPMRIGTVKTLRVHVEGVPAGKPATMHFEVGGAATLVGGAPSTDVPVINGTAEVTIKAVRSGQLEARYQLKLTMPEE
jgi:hypothetical protein